MAGGAVPPPAPRSCVEVGPDCPVEGTIYGYYPSLGANAFFAAFFGLALILNIALGIRFRTWTYMVAMCLGCTTEVAGYAGRLMMYNNPFNSTGFQIQICTLILAPAYFAAGIYISLKHFALTFGVSWSRLRPAMYTYIFIAGDLLSLALQGAGGGLAATSDPGSATLDMGTNLMIAGVIFQVVILFVFGYLAFEYAIRTYRRTNQLSPSSLALLHDTKFRLFVTGLFIAYLGIFVRCVYRIPELSGGWRSKLMRNEPEFIALEGVMIAIAVFTMTLFHPGFGFPTLGRTMGKASKVKNIEEGSREMSQS